MKELEECLEALLAEVKPIEKTEYVALTDACDRILGEDIVAQMMIPPIRSLPWTVMPYGQRIRLVRTENTRLRYRSWENYLPEIAQRFPAKEDAQYA